MRVIVVIDSLSDPGGAERVVTIMSNYWAEKKSWDVAIATFDRGESPPYYALSPEVQHDRFEPRRDSWNLVGRALANQQRIHILRQYVIGRNRMKLLQAYFKGRNPDAIISFITETNILTLLSGLRLSFPVIVSERNNPAYHQSTAVTRRLRRWLYPKANAVVCQTQGVLEFFLPSLSSNGVVIPNPVMPGSDDVSVPDVPLPDGKLLFAMGSMSKRKIHQKGFDLLLSAFGNLARKHSDWSLMILGDGSEREALQHQVQERGLCGRVHLPGTVKSVHSLLTKGDLFVLSSRYEGFPNVLCEAMACGLPVVSFDCPTGPSDIVRNGIDGLLVPSEDAAELEKGLDTLMSDQEMREKMGVKAREVVDRFSVEKVMGMWEELIVRCVHER